MKYVHFLLLGILVSCVKPADIPQAPVDWVNPFIGTGGHGHTFPGPTLPFGMMQLGPDTRLTGWDGCSGYHFTDSMLYGFSHTHLSGTGVSDYGDVLLLPTNAPLDISSVENDRHAVFDKRTEHAEAGYYAVRLPEEGIDVELTTTLRCGMHRYVFDESAEPQVVLDLYHRDRVLDAEIRVLDSMRIEGKRVSAAWAEEQHVYFAMVFSEPIIDVQSAVDRPYIKCLVFPEDMDTLQIKVAISAVDTRGAWQNLQSEMTHWDFEKVRSNARNAWNAELEKLTIHSTDKEVLTNFYTALYHTMIAPNTFSDVDGRYRGMDQQIHRDSAHTQYTVFSLWDTYRATHPLYTIMHQDKTGAFIRTLLNQYQQGGIIPIWELAANYTGCMIGYHAIPVIADAHLKGIEGFDSMLALEAMRHSAEQDHLGLEAYKDQGYIPADEESESVSKTLEYAFDDWCIAEMASALGVADVADHYYERAAAYRHIFDPESGFFRSKMNGAFIEPFIPEEVNVHFTEANAWQYRFYVPQDIRDMIALVGGNDAFESALDSLFETDSETSGRNQADITGLIGQYAHGNEPSHHMAYLYNFVGKPEKTQQRIREICTDLYDAAPDGLSGNEDCGQMSAWYVFSALGFYPVTPCSEYYVIGVPMIDSAEIRLENGRSFAIEVEKMGRSNQFVQRVLLNGKPHPLPYVRHSEIMDGGTLTYVMGDQVPDQLWYDTDFSYCRISGPVLPVPYTTAADMAFTDHQEIGLNHAMEEAEIYYKLDSKPVASFQLYKSPIRIEDDEGLLFFARHEGLQSDTVYSVFRKIRENRRVELLSEYAPQYAAGGDDALIDFLLGKPDFRIGFWQGFEGIDLEAIVDLESAKKIKRVALRCLQDQRSWIFMPESVTFFTSLDKQDWEPVGEVRNDLDPMHDGPVIKEMGLTGPWQARYVKIVVENRKTVPEWHLGAGGKAWIFTDEIVIEE